MGMIDRSAFWLAVAGGIAGWAYIARRPAAPSLPSCQERIRRFLLLCAIATGGLLPAVICDGVLTALRLSGLEWSVYFLIPLLTMAIEIDCSTLLVFLLHEVAQHLAHAAQLTAS